MMAVLSSTRRRMGRDGVGMIVSICSIKDSTRSGASKLPHTCLCLVSSQVGNTMGAGGKKMLISRTLD